MKKLLLSLLFLFVSGCNLKIKQDRPNIVPLGPAHAEQTWVYLCGLTSDFYTPQEIELRAQLSALGKKINVKFLAIEPFARCLQFENKLCWPHNTQDEIMHTYHYIMKTLKNQKVTGFIGFSNGGFFLNMLAQYVALDAPLISIGAAGYFHQALVKNTLYMVIGKKDFYHYQEAQEFYKKSLGSPLHIMVLEHEEGHIIPIGLVEKIILTLSQQGS